MSRCGHRGWGALLAFVLGGVAMVGLAGCKTIHEELQPVRETTLTVARSGGDVTLSWIGMRGMYYSVMYTEARGARAKWNFLSDAANVRGLATGEPIIVKDRLMEPTQTRYYRLVQDSKPLVP